MNKICKVHSNFFLELFDRDRDGILTVKELQMLLRCLGLKPDLEQVIFFSSKKMINLYIQYTVQG